MYKLDFDIVGLSASELVDWVRLIRTNRVGPVNFFKLVDMFGSVEVAIAEIPNKSGNTLSVYNKNKALDDIAEMERQGVYCLSIHSPYYPPLLRTINSAPPLIFVKGHYNLCSKVAIGIVGTRNASLNGIKQTEVFARELGENGYLVVSGMAKGIDTYAHKASLNKGSVAVLAGSVDNVYPKENQDLYDELVERGAVISEEFLGTQPIASHFPKRNRLISGISRGVLVIEADIKSGSLITANYAAEQGREVFAVPGSPSNTRSAGCNQLIKEGANIATKTSDIIDVLRANKNNLSDKKDIVLPYQNQLSNVRLSDADIKNVESKILGMLDYSPVYIDDVIRAMPDYSASVVSAVLLLMELSGKVVKHNDNMISLL